MTDQSRARLPADSMFRKATGSPTDALGRAVTFPTHGAQPHLIAQPSFANLAPPREAKFNRSAPTHTSAIVISGTLRGIPQRHA